MRLSLTHDIMYHSQTGKAQIVTLLSHKRSQNTAIVLARLKKTPEEVLRAIQTLQVEAFASVDQVRTCYFVALWTLYS